MNKEEDMNRISVIGMGMSPEDFTLKHLEIIRTADIIAGGKRHLDSMKQSVLLPDSIETKTITSDIKSLVAFIKKAIQQKKNVVVIASGDPLYFGIGSTLIKYLGSDAVSIYPNITSVGAAFSKIKESWQNAYVLSLHGKEKPGDFKAILSDNDTIAVFTDLFKNPSWLSEQLIESGFTDFHMYIVEQMNSENEKIGCYKPIDVINQSFSEPNIVILKREKQVPATPENRLRLGSPDTFFQHQNGLITKSEVRAVTISKLDLKEDSVLWDLGAGSGSVAIEASLFISNGQIIAVEKEEERIQDILENMNRFDVTNLDVIQRVLPDTLDDLNEPDRVFIGGGGKHLDDIIANASKRLRQNGIIVINTVILQNMNTAIERLKNEGFKTEIVQVNISFSHEMPLGEMLKSHNPVWVIKGTR